MLAACMVPAGAARAGEGADGPVLAAYGGGGEVFDLAAVEVERIESAALPPAGPFGLRGEGFGDAEALEEALFRRRVARREIVYQVLNAVDAVQTISCLDRGVCHELNPLLGRNPSAGKVLAFKAASGGVYYLVTKLLQAEAPGAVGAWQITSIAIQGGAVAWNMQFVF